jgi:RNA polymerase sigma-70 factor (ECF subfamily)
MEPPSDRALVLQTRRGDIQAYGELINRHERTVFNICYRLLGERRDAQDLTQEAFLRGFLKLASFDEERPFGPWIYKITSNLCLNALQHHNGPPPESDAEMASLPTSPQDSPESTLVQGEQTEAIRQAILSLPAHYRVVIEMRHYQNLAYKEIAQALQIPQSGVKSHLFRARKHLAELLSAHD